MDAAYELSVLQITPPHFNSSYNMKFYGLSLQGNPANATQRPVFDYYARAIANQPSALNTTNTIIVTPSLVELSEFNSTWQRPMRPLFVTLNLWSSQLSPQTKDVQAGTRIAEHIHHVLKLINIIIGLLIFPLISSIWFHIQSTSQRTRISRSGSLTLETNPDSP
jgi:hypothetical protein